MLASTITDAKNSRIIPRVTGSGEEVPENGGGHVMGSEQDLVTDDLVGSSDTDRQTSLPAPEGSNFMPRVPRRRPGSAIFGLIVPTAGVSR